MIKPLLVFILVLLTHVESIETTPADLADNFIAKEPVSYVKDIKNCLSPNIRNKIIENLQKIKDVHVCFVIIDSFDRTYIVNENATAIVDTRKQNGNKKQAAGNKNQIPSAEKKTVNIDGFMTKFLELAPKNVKDKHNMLFIIFSGKEKFHFFARSQAIHTIFDQTKLTNAFKELESKITTFGLQTGLKSLSAALWHWYEISKLPGIDFYAEDAGLQLKNEAQQQMNFMKRTESFNRLPQELPKEKDLITIDQEVIQLPPRRTGSFVQSPKKVVKKDLDALEIVRKASMPIHEQDDGNNTTLDQPAANNKQYREELMNQVKIAMRKKNKGHLAKPISENWVESLDQDDEANKNPVPQVVQIKEPIVSQQIAESLVQQLDAKKEPDIKNIIDFNVIDEQDEQEINSNSQVGSLIPKYQEAEQPNKYEEPNDAGDINKFINPEFRKGKAIKSSFDSSSGDLEQQQRLANLLDIGEPDNAQSISKSLLIHDSFVSDQENGDLNSTHIKPKVTSQVVDIPEEERGDFLSRNLVASLVGVFWVGMLCLAIVGYNVYIK